MINEDWQAVSGKGELKLSENSLTVLKRRYLRKDDSGKSVETPEDMFRRVASNIASADLKYDPMADVKRTANDFYDLLVSLDFMPNSPTLMNAGRELQQLSACFVLPVGDSLEEIFTAIKQTALIHQSGGGTGFDFSRLRPAGSIVKSTKGVASGPISFMKAFDSATEVIKQGGTRRGANMGILRVDHPDIESFIKAKEKNDVLNNFNISVALTDRFMEALEKDDQYELVDPKSKRTVRKESARKIFDIIVDHAWKNGEPGIIFIDRMNRYNPTPKVGKIESTNPCGEQPLLPYESCNLGSINLGNMVRGGQVDYAHLSRVVRKVTHFLDNVIDVNNYPIAEIREMTKANRKIGMGVMGWADMLFKLGVRYDSEEALELGEKIMKFIRTEGRKESARLALERGPFPNFKGSIFDKEGQPRLRNATVTTIAPTGTISIIAGASSGVEPLFAISFIRTVMDNDRLVEVHPYFKELGERQGWYSEELAREIAEKGTIQGNSKIPKNVQELFVTAHEVNPDFHVRMQAAFQRYTDNAVSKTINFPQEATREDVEEVYMLAYRSGCKGITVYRDGSREAQVLSKGSKQKKEEKLGKEEEKQAESKEVISAEIKVSPRSRPEEVSGVTYKAETGCGTLYITVNQDEKSLVEVFTTMGKSGGCLAAQSEAISRLASLAFRAGIDAKEVVRQIKGIRCPLPRFTEHGTALSCPDVIAQVIERHLQKKQATLGLVFSEEEEKRNETNANNKEELNKVLANGKEEETRSVLSRAQAGLPPECPDCGNMLEISEGCLKCQSCGFSRCT
jgi:ribonucleoside-diphosphate reductase alpha chain